MKIKEFGKYFTKTTTNRDGGECIFKASGGENFGNFSAQRQSWWRICGFDVCAAQSKKLRIRHCQRLHFQKLSFFSGGIFKYRTLAFMHMLNFTLLRKYHKRDFCTTYLDTI